MTPIAPGKVVDRPGQCTLSKVGQRHHDTMETSRFDSCSVHQPQWGTGCAIDPDKIVGQVRLLALGPCTVGVVATIRLSEAAFACYSKVCAPPPAGHGGSTKDSYWKGKRRGTSSRKVMVSREYPTKMSQRREREIADNLEATAIRKAKIRTHFS